MMRFTFSILFVATVTSCVKDSKTEHQVSFHENGKLKHEIFLKSGKRDGIERIYFESGNLKAVAHWRNGEKNGKNVIYYENGIMRQEKYYVDGLICCLSNDYDSLGHLRTSVKLDSMGRIIDFMWFDSLGNRDFSDEYKNALFISQSDTITLGETYHAEIKLGNRQFDNIRVTIGDLNDRYLLLKSKPLPNKDSTTAIFSFMPTTNGNVIITGVIQEKNIKGDSSAITTFEHNIYVKSN